MGGGIPRKRRRERDRVGRRRRRTEEGELEAIQGPVRGKPPEDEPAPAGRAQETERWSARFQVANGTPPSPGSGVTIRPGPVLGVIVDGREIGTLVGDDAEFVAGYIRQGYTFSGEISAFDDEIREGEVALVGTAPDEA